MTKKHKIPSFLSLQRCCMITDGLFYNTYSDEHIDPVFVFRHGMRGTKNLLDSDNAKCKADSPANIQTTDTAMLSRDSEALRVLFYLRCIDVSKSIFSIAPGVKDTKESIDDFKKHFNAFIMKAKKSDALDQIACRYIRNIANGRFLWRNRTVAQSVTITVTNRDGLNVTFNALEMPFNSFDGVSDDERAAAKVLSDGWKGEKNDALHISAIVDFGVKGRVQVFPSQEFIDGKPLGIARILYAVGGDPREKQNMRSTYGFGPTGQAALRDQKIGNALRTIDTWYPAYGERGIPIPVEPNGANLDAQEFFRNKGGASGFKLMERVGELDPSTPEGLFLLACIIRGGVFSGKD